MRKIFTLALALLATLGMRAGTETFTFNLTAAGTKGYCYALEGPASGAFLENNAIYYTSLNGPAKDGDDRLNPYKTGIVFAPKMDLTMAVSLVAGSSARTFNLRIEEIQNDYVWNAFVNCAGEAMAMPEKIFELADDTEKAWWKENGGGKVIKGEGTEAKPYTAGTDDGSKKYMSGESASEGMAKNVGTSESISIGKNETKENEEITVSGSAYTFSKDKKYRLYLIPSSSTGLGLVSISFTASCEAPAEPLTFTATPSSEIYVGDEITFSSAGGNGGEKPITLDGNPFTAEKWAAEAGEHKFVMTQDTKDGKCGATIEIKLNVATKDKVESAKITGSNVTFIGKEITLTCEAANATSWQWYKDGAKITDAKSAEYKFTPTAAGNVVFAVEAWNKFNEEGKPAKSADFTVEVSDFECGVLARIDVTAADKATLTGSFEGTASVKNLSNDAKNKSEYDGKTGYKLYKEGSYIGADFTSGTIKAKDKVIVFVTTASEKMQIFSDKGSTMLIEVENVVQGENIIALGDNAEGATALYVCRTMGGEEGAKYNPHIAYIELKRPCHEESNDASIKSLKIGDKEVEAKDNLYALELASDFAEMQLEITFELNESHATADKKSPFSVLAPENSTDTIKSEINVTAEDGTKAHYAIQITRAEAPKSTDASITELKINEVAVAEKEGIFAYEVAFDAELDSVAVAFVLAEKATADKKSPFKVLVPEAGAAAVEEAINVTAEDGVTKKEYKVSVTKAKKSEEAIDNIGDGAKAVKFFENGQLLIRKNGVLYNAQGAIVK